VYARLNGNYGWTTVNEDGQLCSIVLSGVQRYAGMVSGKAVHDGRIWARPMGEFEALSEDGMEWKPFYELRSLIPWETYVQQDILHLPDERGGSN
jgi:hypothetical protein